MQKNQFEIQKNSILKAKLDFESKKLDFKAQKLDFPVFYSRGFKLRLKKSLQSENCLTQKIGLLPV